jgi:hypothetical protein
MIDLSTVILVVGLTFTVGWVVGFLTGRWTREP